MAESSQTACANLGQWLIPLLQTSDPLFPTGSYAHSLGLEEVVQMGQVTDPQSLCEYLQDRLTPYLQNLELPHMHYLYKAAAEKDWDSLINLDFEVSAMKLTREFRQASGNQGRQRLRLLRNVFPSPVFEKFAELARETSAPCNHQTIFALQHSLQNVPVEACLMAWFYQAIAAQCAASMKLIRIGEEGCQKIIARCMLNAPQIVSSAIAIPREQIGWFNPVLDIASSRHERAYVRLFIS
jgi:urease accessory protein